MAINHREELQKIRTFPSLIRYLRDELGWPIETDDFEELTFEYTPEELGIDEKNSAAIESIKRLRPLVPNQPWGIFFVKFEPKQLPVVALRRILSKVVIKKRASAHQAEHASWAIDDLLFVSNYGESDKRSISFAHFSQGGVSNELPRLKVLGWDNRDTALHLDDIAEKLTINLSWPSKDDDVDSWRSRWRSAFTVEHKEVITTAKRLSIRLAELAQAVRDRIKSALAIESEDGPLTKLMGDFQQALINDLDRDSFADMYAQTIAYGLLSVRITDPKSTTAEDLTKHIHTSPFLHELMTSFMKAGGIKGEGCRSSIDFDELGVSEVVELLDNANMEAILRDFGDKNPQEDPVIHFYESFLSHYDANKKMKRGVFYTPKPVVSFIVRSVDELLKTEFGLEDGLADITTWGAMTERNPDLEIPEGLSETQAFVQILDPATGTGTFLVEVIDLIYKQVVTKWSNQGYGKEKINELWNEYVPKYLFPRLHGFELLMAPYAIAHMKIGLKLYETGYRFEKSERLRIYLTNALEPAEDRQLQISIMPSLAHEFLEVSKLKSKSYFTVVIGNPPYSGHSANKGKWIEGLLKNYKQEPGGGKLKEKNPKWLNDDYVKFIRYGQYLINSYGILAFISNHSFLENPTFRGMRWFLLNSFNIIYIVDLHGNTKKKEICPDGSPDENVFDIQQGVSISIFLKNEIIRHTQLGKLWFADIFGERTSKYKYLLSSGLGEVQFKEVRVQPTQYLFNKYETKCHEVYDTGFFINELFSQSAPGVVTGNDAILINMNQNELYKTIEEHIDYKPNNDLFAMISYRAFDDRPIYFDKDLIVRDRAKIMKYIFNKNNLCIIYPRKVSSQRPFNHIMCSRSGVIARYFLDATTVTYFAPLYLYKGNSGQLEIPYYTEFNPNLNEKITSLIAKKMGIKFALRKKGDSFTPIDLFDYIYAVLHCPTYREKYRDNLEKEFPRIPYPEEKGIFWKLIELGCELRQIHLFESPANEENITTYDVGGDNQVKKIEYGDMKVMINQEQYFDGVPIVAWDFYIGGSQPAQKWIKDRKGMVLNNEDIIHYQKIIKALVETDRIMKEIDKVATDWI